MSCSVASLPIGSANKQCDQDTIKGLILTSVDEVWTDRTILQTDAQLKTGIQEDLDITVFGDIYDYEPTVGETIKSESPLTGAMSFIRRKPGSLVVNIETNPCDWNEAIDKLKGGLYRVGLVYANGDTLATKGDLQTVKYFLAKVYATPHDITGKDDVNKGYVLEIAWQDAKEWEKVDYITPVWDLEDLQGYAPASLNADEYSVLAGSTQTIVVRYGCVAEYASMDLTAEVRESNVTSETVTPTYVASSLGKYSCDIQKGSTPTDLTSGNFVTYRVVVKDGSGVYTYVSNDITAQA